jgi:hypothetical protein
MRNGLVIALVLTGFLLGTVTFATAGVVTWTVLESSNPAGMGPGPDGEIGVPGCPGTADNDDTTSGEWNTCNFDLTASCMTTGSPTSGSYSYSATEYLYANTCYAGANIGLPCNDDTDCPDSQCYPCVKNPGWDLVLYMGDIGVTNANGTMTMCQEGGGATITSLKTGMSSPDPLAGPLCNKLDPAGGPYTTSACGVDVPISYSIDTISSLRGGNCLIPVGGSGGLTTQARVIDINDATPTATCGYTAADILCLQAEAPPTATYLLITCITATMPDPVPILCLSGAQIEAREVYWTADNASDCTSACGGSGCMAGTAEGLD